jgi:hypothetical protein
VNVAVLVLRAKSNRPADLKSLVPALLAAIPLAPKGIATLIGSD